MRYKTFLCISRLTLFIIIAFLGAVGVSIAYQPPVGIPDPGKWGTTHPVDAAAPSQPGSWPGAEYTGCYYIDSTDGDATDNNNTYGYPNKPRLTIPSTFAAGSYVEIHGGPYTNIKITANGTSGSIVWIRGTPGNKPVFRDLRIAGSFVIAEYFHFDTNGQGFSFNSPTQYGCLRNSTYYGSGTLYSSNNSGFGCSGSSPTEKNDYIIFYNNEIKELGAWQNNTNYDYHGIKPRYNVSHVWILGNTIYHTQGDSVQTGEASSGGNDFPQYVYIGGNTFYDNKENSIDIKDGNDIIISENLCYGMNTDYGDDEGAAIVIHEEADNVWIVNNRVHTCDIGIITTGSTNTWFIGNLIYNIKHSGSFDAGSFYGSGAAMHFRGNTNGGAVGNTVYNCDKGIQLTSGSNYDIYNNIFSNRAESSAYDIMVRTTSIAASTDIDYCHFYRSDGNIRINWAGIIYTSVSAFKNGAIRCDNCPLEADPKFVNPPSNFTLQSDSPDRNNSAEYSHPVYNIFYNQYGIDIAKDIAGTSRPQEQNWDIGAYEVRDGISTVKNLKIVKK